MTEETLTVPKGVFAIGSPKMKLLKDGMWAHGGKTDPGYNLGLTLVFQHVGTRPIKVKRGDKIFHLTFFIADGWEGFYDGGRIGFPQTNMSRIELSSMEKNDKCKSVREVDGLKSARLYHHIVILEKRLRIAVGTALVSPAIVVFIAALYFLNLLPDVVTIGAIITTIVIGIVINLLSELVKKRSGES